MFQNTDNQGLVEEALVGEIQEGEGFEGDISVGARLHAYILDSLNIYWPCVQCCRGS